MLVAYATFRISVCNRRPTYDVMAPANISTIAAMLQSQPQLTCCHYSSQLNISLLIHVCTV